VESGLPFGAPIDAKKLTELDAKGWELYHVEKDVAETHNLAEKEHAKLIEMIGMWYVEAGKYNVMPIVCVVRISARRSATSTNLRSSSLGRSMA